MPTLTFKILIRRLPGNAVKFPIQYTIETLDDDPADERAQQETGFFSIIAPVLAETIQQEVYRALHGAVEQMKHLDETDLENLDSTTFH
jgi:hypothetical protein